MKSALFLSLLVLFSSAAPSFAQMATLPADDHFGAPKSKVADVDILTNSPTMQINGGVPAQLGAQYNFQSAPAVPMQQMTGYSEISPGLGIQQNEAVSSIAQQMGGNVQQMQLPQGQIQQGTMLQGQMQQAQIQQAQVPQNVQAQSAPKAPMQIDGQAVGRMVGVAGTAIMLGAFLKNGGMGGMMNSFGFNNRFRGQVSGW